MKSRPPQPEEVEHLLRNAQLRDDIAPYLDESICRVNVQELPTPVENEFLASMLAWELALRAGDSPVVHAALELPHPDTLADARTQKTGCGKQFASYSPAASCWISPIILTDRELYTLIYRDILPSPEKKIDAADNYLHWDCADMGGDPEIWLRYYATPEERESWAADLPGPLPAHEIRRIRGPCRGGRSGVLWLLLGTPRSRSLSSRTAPSSGRTRPSCAAHQADVLHGGRSARHTAGLPLPLERASSHCPTIAAMA